MSGKNLQKIDYFCENKKDEESRTWLGVWLTLVIPVLLVGYGVYVYLDSVSSPPTMDVEVLPTWSSVFTLLFRCNAPKGCYMTNNYDGEDSKLCKQKILTAYPNYAAGCMFIPVNTVVELPFCYTSDPVDGPKFVWERFVACDGTTSGKIDTSINRATIPRTAASSLTRMSTAPTTTPTYNTTGRECRAGVSLYNWFVNPNTGDLNGPMVLSLFAGTHLLQLSNVTAEYRSDKSHALQAPPVQVSTQSVIDSTNLCCAALGIDCYKLGDPGTANDHTELTAAALPGSQKIVNVAGTHLVANLHISATFDQQTLDKPVLWYQVLDSMGAAWNVITFAFGLVVTAYRMGLMRRSVQPTAASMDQKAKSAPYGGY